ncbi:MAG: ABC transporter ATP-binding protein [Chloroflexota bacterium]
MAIAPEARPPVTDPSTLAVSVKNVSMVYTVKTGEVVALDNVSLDVRPGELVTLIGPSGCGKSTLLRIVADILQPTLGELTVDGMTPHEARSRRKYSFVFQNPVMLPWLSLQKNVELALNIIGSDAGERARTARELIELVGLGGFEEALPNQLSGGMRQRGAIARALTTKPDILLMDEPFGALDEITRERMNFELLRILKQTGAAVMFVTHSIDEAVILSDRIVVMTARPGRIRSVFDIDLPKPRSSETRYLPRFTELTLEVRRALHDADDRSE